MLGSVFKLESALMALMMRMCCSTSCRTAGRLTLLGAQLTSEMQRETIRYPISSERRHAVDNDMGMEPEVGPFFCGQNVFS